MADTLEKLWMQRKPSPTYTLVKTLSTSDYDTSYTATADGWFSLTTANSNQARTIKGYIREAGTGLGMGFTVTFSAYIAGPITMMPCRKGITYNIHTEGQTSELYLYQY